MSNSSPSSAWKIAVPTVILYASGYPVGSAAVAVMSPLLVIVIRFALSAIVLWTIVAIRRPSVPSRSQIMHAAVAGLLVQGVQFIALYWALSQGVGSGLAALVIALNPVMTATLLTIFTSHRESGRGLVALVLGAIAVAVACAPQILEDPSIGLPVIAVVAAMFGLTTGGLYQQRNCAGMDPILITAIGVTASLPVSVGAMLSAPIEVTNWALAAFLLVVMVGLSSVGATILYATCIARFGARVASVLFAVIPSVAGLLAWVFLGEALSLFTIVGLLMGAAACLVQFSAHGDARTTQESHARKVPVE